MIRRALDDGWRVEVAAIDLDAAWAAPLHPGDMGPGLMRSRFAGPQGGMHLPPALRGMSFVAQVRLHDGSLVTFDARQPEQAAGWPYRVLASLAVLLAAVVGVSLLAVRWATRPLKVLADAADELGRNIHRPPMAETGSIEVARAAHAFNTMQARLVAYLRERTSVLAAMSHDLKTPVTRLRLRAELLPEAEQRRKFTQDVEEMEAMVAATLEYLRGAYGRRRSAGRHRCVAGKLAVRCGGNRRAREPDRAAATAVQGSAHRIEALPAQSGRERVKYGEGASVEVCDDAGQLQIIVRDDGPGLPPQGGLESRLELPRRPGYLRASSTPTSNPTPTTAPTVVQG